MTAIAPPALNKGDTIGVFAPSSWVEKEDIERSKTRLEELGYNVFVHPQTFERENQSAGTNLQKALALQGLWQRKDIKAIWAAGGGNRCTHLLETLKFKPFERAPKLLIGFSDVTSLLNGIYANTDIITIHGPVFKNLHSYKQMDHLLALLGGEQSVYPLTKDNVLQDGKASGKLIGGNLSIFQYLPQTQPNDFYKDSILFLEDCNEEISRIDRTLLQLRRLKVFDAVKAIVFGEFISLQDSSRPFGYSMEDIIAEHTMGLDIPILHNMPFGHGENLYSFPIGCEAEINTEALSFKLTDSATTNIKSR